MDEIVEDFEDRGITALILFTDSDHQHDENLSTDTAMLKVLLDHGVDISEANYDGIGILHFAVIRNDKDIVKLLLDAGADATYKDPRGKTPAYWAWLLGYHGILELLSKGETFGEED